MDEQALNKKLVEWAVPAAIEVQVQKRQIVIETDEGTGHIELLTESLDTCFKLLVPGVITKIREDQGMDEILAYTILFNEWRRELIGTMDYSDLLNIATYPALALCLAIEKLIPPKQT